MDYEKAYKDALERAKNLHKDAIDMGENIRAKQCEIIFPELKESGDERIRNRLIAMCQHYIECYSLDPYNTDGYKEALAWLEKQGEQKTTDKVEPKFKKDEWITNGDYTWKIVEVKHLDYILQSQDGNIVDDTISHVDDQFHSFTTEDAKDGDVLDANGAPFIYKKHDKDYVYFYCGVNLADEFIDANGIDTWNNNNKVYPATKEQRDLLFQKMKEARYEWDDKKKELKKVKEEPAWSEEDERERKRVVGLLEGWLSTFKKTCYAEDCKCGIEWLKSLKQRIGE